MPGFINLFKVFLNTNIHLSANNTVNDYGVSQTLTHVLGFVSHFIRALEKCSTNMKELLQACVGSVDENFNKDIEELLSYIELQYSTIASIGRILEMVTVIYMGTVPVHYLI